MDQHALSRIDMLRRAANPPLYSFDSVYLDFFRRYKDNGSLGSEQERYADAYLYAMEHIRPAIDAGELIVGKPAHPLKEEDREEFERLRPLMDEFAVMYGQDSHMAVDYRLLLAEGTCGIAKKIDRLRSETDEPDKLRFYDCCKVCLHAVEVCADNHADAAEKLAEACTDPEQKRSCAGSPVSAAVSPVCPPKAFTRRCSRCRF